MCTERLGGLAAGRGFVAPGGGFGLGDAGRGEAGAPAGAVGRGGGGEGETRGVASAGGLTSGVDAGFAATAWPGWGSAGGVSRTAAGAIVSAPRASTIAGGFRGSPSAGRRPGGRGDEGATVPDVQRIRGGGMNERIASRAVPRVPGQPGTSR